MIPKEDFLLSRHSLTYGFDPENTQGSSGPTLSAPSAFGLSYTSPENRPSAFLLSDNQEEQVKALNKTDAASHLKAETFVGENDWALKARPTYLKKVTELALGCRKDLSTVQDYLGGEETMQIQKEKT